MTYDNLARPLCQRALRAWAFGALILLGTLVIFTFDPCIDPNAVNYLPEVCSPS